MNPLHVNYRKQLLVICLVLALSASVLYDTRFIINLEGLRTVVAAVVIAFLGLGFLLVRYPVRFIQPALLATWPLHAFSICFVGLCFFFHGGARLTEVIAYTIVAYATYLLVPLWLLLDWRLFDAFAKIVAIGCAALAIPAYIGAMGIDSIFGFPLSNKYDYSNFSGIIASGGLFEFAEGLALQMSIGLFCCYYAIRKTGNWLYLVCLVMIVAGLAVSQGRGAIFGVVIAVAFCLLPELFRRSRPLFVGSLALCLVFPFLIWPQLTNIPGVADYLRLERGLSGREVAWLYAFSLVEEKPWTGHGFGSSSVLSEDAEEVFGLSGYSGVGTTFHNTFITKAVELGIIGTGVYCLLYIFPFLRICHPTDFRQEQELVRSIIILILTASIFRDYNIGGVRSTAVMVGVFLGLANLWPSIADSEARPEYEE